MACGLAAFANWSPWYTSLRLPPLTPPEHLLAALWGVIYVSMAFAGWQIWRVPDVKLSYLRALISWGWVLVIKSFDITVVFGLHLLLVHVAMMLGLAVMLGTTIGRFWRLNRGAAWGMAPYAAWVGFQIYLSLGFWWLNR